MRKMSIKYTTPCVHNTTYIRVYVVAYFSRTKMKFSRFRLLNKQAHGIWKHGNSVHCFSMQAILYETDIVRARASFIICNLILILYIPKYEF